MVVKMVVKSQNQTKDKSFRNLGVGGDLPSYQKNPLKNQTKDKSFRNLGVGGDLPYRPNPLKDKNQCQPNEEHCHH
jgi:hypothetical protein